MAYDAARGRVVLSGGWAGPFVSECDDGQLGDCGHAWEWDGTSWARLPPTNMTDGASPCPRQSHALAYDAARRRLVMFGGYNARNDGCPTCGERLCGDTWELPGRSGHGTAAAVIRARFDAVKAAEVKLVSVTARINAGGYAAYGLDETPGLRLMVYDRGTFMPAAVAGHHSSDPGELTWTTRDPLQLQRLPVGERKEISFAVVSPDLPGAGRAQVAIDQMEVVVRYRLPAP